jgi:phage terminase large subunit-like protein
MLYDEEKDYIMRMIREVSRVLFSIIFGKRYAQVELEIRNKYETAGTPQNALKDLVDRGQIDKAENMLLEDIDYSRKEDIASAVVFYQYLGEKPDSFLEQHNFSRQEVLDGLNNLAECAGYAQVVDMMVDSKTGDGA